MHTKDAIRRLINLDGEIKAFLTDSISVTLFNSSSLIIV